MGKTCGYCGSKIEKINEVQYYCDFCTMTLSGSSVKGVQSQKCEFCTLRPFQHKNSRYSVH